MRIVVRRTGGFTGLPQVWMVDTRRLSHQNAADVERMAHSARKVPGEERTATIADGFRWDVEIDGELHTAADGSAVWTDLIDRVRSLHRKEP